MDNDRLISRIREIYPELKIEKSERIVLVRIMTF